jgi:hypothetical protein
MCISVVKRGGLDPINLFSPKTCLCMSQAMILISNVMFRDLFVQCVKVRKECSFFVVDISGIVEHHCLNCLFKIRQR